MRADLVADALRQAVALRGELPGKVIFHADRGCQYTSQQIADLCGDLDLLRSMGRTGVCWDNAAAESFWSTLKNEYYHRHVFTTIDQARRGVYTWIDGWYNARRRHSAIGYLSPLQYEHQQARQAEPAGPPGRLTKQPPVRNTGSTSARRRGQIQRRAKTNHVYLSRTKMGTRKRAS